MRCIWKYQLNEVGDSFIEMPDDAQVLCAQLVAKIPCVYALGDPGAAKRTRRFRLVATGELYDDAPSVYLGTLQFHGPSLLVFHVIEVLALN